MKRKFSVILLAVAVALCMAFGLTACDKTSDPADHVHSMTKVEKIDPTCTADGIKELWHCTVCGKDFTDEAGKEVLGDVIIPKLGHHMEKVAKADPTCIADGTKEHWHCTGCGKDFADEAGKEALADVAIPKLGHQMTKMKKVDPTCTEDGTEEHWHCTVCGKDFADKEGKEVLFALAIPKLGHELKRVGNVVPTCTEDGAKEHWHCTVCGKDFADRDGKNALDDVTVPKLGHQMTKVEKVDPTCTAEGTKAYWQCESCHKKFVDEAGSAEAGDLTIQKLAHTPEEYIEQEATCDVPGKKWQRCSVCHTALSGEETIPVLGHDWGDWISNGDETCTADGTETRKCRRANCDASETHTRFGSSLGHDYDENGVCRRCRQSAGPLDGAPVVRGDGKIVFGSYPQSEVKNEETVSALTQQAGALPTAENAGAWTAYPYYLTKTVSDYMWYIDLQHGYERYRGVYFTSYRPYYVELGGYASSSYQDENGYTAEQVYWFRYDPIEWHILEKNDESAFLAADLILDSQQFYHSSLTYTEGERQISPNNYAESDVRAWLRDCFYETAFNALQQKLIETTAVNNGATSMAAGDESYACENTNDKVFLLGYREAMNSAYFSGGAARKLAPTDYAKSQGLKMEQGPQWWLRSPHGNASYFVRAIDGNGSAENFINVQNTCCGVVPALRVRLSGGSEAKTGDPVVREDGKIEFGSYPQTEVKDEAKAAALTRMAGELPTAEDAHGWTDYGYYQKREIASYMWYLDLEAGGEKYRGVYFTQYRPYRVGWESSIPNSYQDDHGYFTGQVYWFKFEPIVWRVLTQKQGASLLMADLVLDAQNYSEIRPRKGDDWVSPDNYAASEIRKWLNDTFYETAFNGYRRALIETTAISFPDESDPNGLTWEVVQDKVFLLSQEDVTNGGYGFAPGEYDDAKRGLKATDYAKSQSAETAQISDVELAYRWWLRTSDSEFFVKVVQGMKARDYRDSTYISGVVPAIWLRIPETV